MAESLRLSIRNNSLKFLLFLIILASILINSWIYLGHDVSWHLLATQRLLDGGTYTNDFMDINPPMLLYILIPAVLLHKIGLSLPFAFKLYVFVMAFISFLLCIYLSKYLFEKNTQAAFSCVLAFVFFLLPLHEFGQREHMFLLLCFPYFLLLLARIKTMSISCNLICIIGLMAGVGFLVNIEYLMVFVVINLYYLILSNKISSLWRLENLLIVSVFGCYLLSLWFITPDYITFVFPLVLSIFTNAYNESWLVMFFSLPALIFYTTCVIAIWSLRQLNSKAKDFTKLLLLLNGLFFCDYILTRKLWYYHQLPLLAISIMLLIFSLHEVYPKLRFEKKLLPLLLISLVVLVLPGRYYLKLVLQNLTQNTPYLNNSLRNTIKFVKDKAEGQPVFVFTADMWQGLLSSYADVNYGSRFGNLWMMPGIMEKKKQHLTGKSLANLNSIIQLQGNMLNQDFIKYKPKLVLVQMSNYQNYFVQPVDYLAFFLQSSQFREIWSHYHYIGNIGLYRAYIRNLS